MQYYVISLLLAFTIIGACQNKDMFYPQKTRVNQDQLPETCAEDLVAKINDSWMKHGIRPCHKFTVAVQYFALNEACAKGMEVDLIIQLLGKPDIQKPNVIGYQMDDDCDEEMDNKPHFAYRKDIGFRFDNKTNKIIEVSYGPKSLFKPREL